MLNHPETRRLLGWLLPLLGLALVLRLVGIDHGLPHSMIADEDMLVGAGLRMGATGALVPALSEQMSSMLTGHVLLAWLYLLLSLPVLTVAWVWNGFAGGTEFQWMVFANLDAVFLMARLSSLSFSVASVALIALVARRLFGERLAGIVAGLLLATSWLPSALAHSAAPWSAMTFFICLSLYIATRYGNRPGPRRAAALGIAAGLGFGMAPMAAMGLVAGIAVHLVRYRRRCLNRNLVWMLVPAALLVALFIVVQGQFLPPAGPGPGGPGAAMGSAATVLWWSDPVLLIAGLTGIVLLLRRHAGLAAMLLGGAALWILALWLTGAVEDRAFLPLLPLLALAAGGAVVQLANSLPLRLLWPAAGLGAFVLLYPLATAGWFSILLASSDTRELAANWLEENLPPGSAVVVDLDPVTLPTSLDGLLDQALFLPDSLDARMRLALDSGWPGTTVDRLRALHVNRATPEAIHGEHGRSLFKDLTDAGYTAFAIAVRDDAPPTGLQRAVLADYEELALFLASRSDGAPHAPDLRTSVLVDGPVWRLFLLERLGRSVLIARAPAS